MRIEEKASKIIIIGLGPHANKFYLPAFMELSKKTGAQLLLGIDLVEKKLEISENLAKLGMELPMMYVEPFQDKTSLPDELSHKLNKFVDENGVNGVIIATEPLVHYAYANWALEKGLNILMDKPITARENVSNDESQAIALASDYDKLLQKYLKLQKTKETAFSICVQRRYEACHRKVAELIKEVAEEFNAPVTSIQAMHADGQWRLPSEIVTQIYHPYCQGYGKCSHSGYHIFDIVYRYLKAGERPGKWPDSIEVFSSFVNPSGFIKQFTAADYSKYFGPSYADASKWTDKELESIYQNFGEMDAFNSLRLIKDGVNIGNISINLLHNSFARRDWLPPGSDLYKGNGRVKHQHYHIQQGPFQNIQVHSYQSNDKHDTASDGQHLLGGDSHFDIYVFRNSSMFKQPQQPLTVYSINDLLSPQDLELGPNQAAKMKSLEEFIGYIGGRIAKNELASNIDDHRIPVNIMSAIYQSNIKQNEGKNPIIKFTA